ncbi:porin [Paraburkholderia sp. SARCC-3016]|uniref:porin n=1 Tax=Paraburkholderia sp. SARCC-3016 TaxID=3058611 RepID=UPI002808F46F|nr:porin [Paraburkholderia sp. SARCC-3016]MDQ7978832.1 porin [Paraburkholderia sp. SARCC-3016]
MKNQVKHYACVAVLCGTSFAAHAQSTGVTLYGVLDSSIQYARSGGQSTTRIDSSNAFPSNWGIQGAEDIGGGVHVNFRLESGINVANGQSAQAGKFFGREAWVGMSGPFGRFQAGLNNTPEMWGLLRFLAGDLGHWDWGHAANNYDFFPSTKIPNSIIYTSPNLNGLTLSLMWGFGANGDPTQPRTLGNTFSAGAYYTNGTLSLEADYLSQVYAKSQTVVASSPTATGTHDLFGVSYDFGPFKLDGLFVLHRGAGDVTITNTNTFAAPNNFYYEVSAQVPNVLRGTLMLSYGQYKLQHDSDGNSTSYGMRYDYRLSKRTGVYGGVSYIQNGSLASFTTNSGQGPGIPVLPGHNQLATVLGMVHSF